MKRDTLNDDQIPALVSTQSAMATTPGVWPQMVQVVEREQGPVEIDMRGAALEVESDVLEGDERLCPMPVE
jgi:hypothetical protein